MPQQVFVPRYYFKPHYLLSQGFEARSARVWMQVREGHGCCRHGGLLRWKDVRIAAQLLVNLWLAGSGGRCGLSLLLGYLITWILNISN